MKIGEAAKLLGVSVKTLQRWDDDGVFKALRNPKNQRYYTDEQIENYVSKQNVKIEYDFLFCEAIMEYYDENNFDGGEIKADELIHKNKNNGLYTVCDDSLVYKNVNQKEVAELFNIPESNISKWSMSFTEYLRGFDGGQYVEVLDTQITCNDCIGYIEDNMWQFTDRINIAISNLKNNEESLNEELNKMIDETVSMVMKEKIDEYLKEIKDVSKGGKLNWK